MLSGDVDGAALPPNVTPNVAGVWYAWPRRQHLGGDTPMRTTLAAFALTSLVFSAGCGSGDDSDAAVLQEAAAEGGGDAASSKGSGDGAASEGAAPASDAGSETGSETGSDASGTPNEGGSDATVTESGAD
jgi:hypothetical protein